MDNYDLTAGVCLSILGYVSKTHRQEGKIMTDISTAVWLTEPTTTPEGQIVWGEHKTQVLYGQDLPCMFRWVHADTDRNLRGVAAGWVPCDQC